MFCEEPLLAAPSALILGAPGQLGSELVRVAASGLQTTALDRRAADILDRAAVRQAVEQYRPDLLINAAAYTAVDRAEADSVAALAVNRDGPSIIAEICRDCGVPLIHISTDYVFDGATADAYDEEDETRPLSVYGASKLAGENAVRAVLDQHIIVRTSWVFSRFGTNFVRTMLKLAKTHDRLNIISDQTGGPTPAASLAASLHQIGRKILAPGFDGWGTFHYAGAPETSWCEFAREIFRQAAGHGLVNRIPVLEPISSKSYGAPAQRPARSVMSCTKIARTFGLTQPDWKVELSKVLADIKSEEGSAA